MFCTLSSIQRLGIGKRNKNVTVHRGWGRGLGVSEWEIDIVYENVMKTSGFCPLAPNPLFPRADSEKLC